MLLRFLLILTVVCSRASTSDVYHRATLETHNYYVLHHNPADVPLHEIAEFLGLEIVERVGELEDHWLARTRTTGDEGADHDHVIDAHTRMTRSRTLSSRGENMSSAILHLSRQIPRRLVVRAPVLDPGMGTIDESPDEEKEEAQYDEEREAERDEKEFVTSDPSFSEQWHLRKNAMNVIPVWKRLGITGKDVVVSVVDSGLAADHRDIKPNHIAAYSYDFVDNKKYPAGPNQEDLHGTQSAGVIAAARNNVCGVGIAFDARIAGIRLWSEDTPVIPSNEAVALNYKYDRVDIYSSSLGPVDDGKTLNHPEYTTQQAFLKGVNFGRRGKGNIFVFAVGNGGEEDIDNCNYDAFANSIYTITVGALEYSGTLSPYSESCAAVMVVAYAGGERGISTIHNNDTDACSSDFRGTSSSVSSASGVFALALEARKDLTWRDIQYLCVETAKVVDPDTPTWEPTANGKRLYSYKYGFGVLDAYKFVKAAKTWPLVKPQTWIKMPPYQFAKKTIWRSGKGKMSARGRFSGGVPLSKEGVTGAIEVTEEMVDEMDFDTIEHVQVKVWVAHSKRGDIEVELESPNEIVSVLGKRRRNDTAKTGLRGWTFSTLKHWGETPLGTWKVHFSDQGNANKGKAIGFSVMFWGCSKGSKIRKYRLPADDRNIFPPQTIL